MPSKVFEPSGQTGADVQAAINAASAVAPATVLCDGVTYTDCACVIPSDDIHIIGTGKTRLMPPATGNVDTLSAQGSIIATTNLTADAAQFTDVVSLASVAGLSVGSFIEFRVTVPNPYDTNTFEHRAVVLAINGNDVSFTPELPFAMPMAATHLVRQLALRSGIKIEGITFDANGNTGVSRGFLGRFLMKSMVEGCDFDGYARAAGIMLHSGLWNKCTDIRALGCGCGVVTESDIYIISQTLGDFENIASRQSTGFGTGLYRSTYCNGRTWSSIKSSERGIKLASLVMCGLDDIGGHQAKSTGVAVTNGCHHLQLGRVRACRNRGGTPGNEVGFWVSDRNEHHVTVNQLIAHDNGTRDIRLFASNHDIVIRMADYGTLDDFGTNNVVLEN